MKSYPKPISESSKNAESSFNHKWKSFSWKGRGNHTKATFNPIPKSLVSRKNSEPLLKDKLPSRTHLTRLSSVSSFQATPSSPLTKSGPINPKPQLLKILSKSTSNISFIAYSKPESVFNVAIGEKFNRKSLTSALRTTSGKKVLSKSKSGDYVSTKSSTTNIIHGQTGLSESSKKVTTSTSEETNAEKQKGKHYPKVHNLVFRCKV